MKLIVYGYNSKFQQIGISFSRLKNLFDFSAIGFREEILKISLHLLVFKVEIIFFKEISEI